MGRPEKSGVVVSITAGAAVLLSPVWGRIARRHGSRSLESHILGGRRSVRLVRCLVKRLPRRHLHRAPWRRGRPEAMALSSGARSNVARQVDASTLDRCSM